MFAIIIVIIINQVIITMVSSSLITWLTPSSPAHHTTKIADGPTITCALYHQLIYYQLPKSALLSPFFLFFFLPQFPSLSTCLSSFFDQLDPLISNLFTWYVSRSSFRHCNWLSLADRIVLMPHAEKATMGEVPVNGEKVHHSQFLDVSHFKPTLSS